MSGLTSDRMRRLIAQAAGVLRLGHRRLAAGRPAAGRQPAVGVRRRRAARGARRQGARSRWSSARSTSITHERILGRRDERHRSRPRSKRGRMLRILRRRILRHADRVERTMAKGLIQTAHWRSTTLIVSETALILGAVVAERALQRRRATVAAGARGHAAQGAGHHLGVPAVPVLRRSLRRSACRRQPHRAVHPHAAGARHHAAAAGGALHAVSRR